MHHSTLLISRDHSVCGPVTACLTAMLLFLSLDLHAGALPPVSRVASDSPPAAGASGDSCLPLLSPDGRFVLFASTANDLLLGTNGLPLPATIPARLNVFLRDRQQQTVTLVSANLAGTGGGNGDSLPLALSTKGQFALFESSASNLVPGDTNGAPDLFLRDLATATTRLISANSNGLPANGLSRSGVMTPDGRYVAFVSEATDLVPGDTNKIADVFRRDVLAGATVLVSVGARATNAALTYPGGGSDAPEITPDGRHVAFASTATNLVTNVRTVGDVYLRDLTAGVTVWASSGMRAAMQAVTGRANAVGYDLALSADGNVLAFQAALSPLDNYPDPTRYRGIVLRFFRPSSATELIHTNAALVISRPEDTRSLALTPDGRRLAFIASQDNLYSSNTCVLVHDADTGTLTLASGDLGGEVPAGSLVSRPLLSGDGRFVTFGSTADGLTTNSAPGEWRLYRRDLDTSTTRLIAGAATPVSVAMLSAEGRWAAFESADATLVGGNRPGNLNVFRRDLADDSLEIDSARFPTRALMSPDGPSLLAPGAASQDGRYVAFASEAANLVPGDTNGFRDIFVRDLAWTNTWLVSGALGGAGANGIASEPAISGDGRYLAFTSSATNLVPGDTNKATDIFLHDRQAGTTLLASVNQTGFGPGNKASYSPSLSANGKWLLYRSLATDLVSGGVSAVENLFLRDLQAGTNLALTTSGVSVAAMTPDGRYTAFAGSSGPLYVWDALLGQRVFTNAVFGIANLTLSPDGGRLAYLLGSSLRLDDVATQSSRTLVTLLTGSRPVPRFSADGRWLVCARVAASFNQVYLHDLDAGTESLVSHALNSTAAASGGHSDAPEISPDGRFVAYRSQATNLVGGMDGVARQIILWDRQTGANTLVTANRLTGGAGDDFATRAVFSPDGSVLLAQSWAGDLATDDANRTSDVFAYSFATAVLLAPETPGQGPRVAWPFVFGNRYRVWFKDDLAQPAWQSLPGNYTWEGVRAQQTDPTPSPQRRFYRVEAF